jgi:hypothetical protein
MKLPRAFNLCLRSVDRGSMWWWWWWWCRLRPHDLHARSIRWTRAEKHACLRNARPSAEHASCGGPIFWALPVPGSRRGDPLDDTIMSFAAQRRVSFLDGHRRSFVALARDRSLHRRNPEPRALIISTTVPATGGTPRQIVTPPGLRRGNISRFSPSETVSRQCVTRRSLGFPGNPWFTASPAIWGLFFVESSYSIRGA